MTVNDPESRGVPTSSGRNRFATGRTLLILAAVVTLTLVALFAPW
jgi:hypothetical protein